MVWSGGGTILVGRTAGVRGPWGVELPLAASIACSIYCDSSPPTARPSLSSSCLSFAPPFLIRSSPSCARTAPGRPRIGNQH